MIRYAKIRLAAKLMVRKYGKAAAPIARLRARRSTRLQDESVAKAWAAIARAAGRLSLRQRKNGQIPLADAPSSLTARILAAHPPKQEDVPDAPA
jgi:hypothetical protein